jgi:hypothetical protein
VRIRRVSISATPEDRLRHHRTVAHSAEAG